mgnify:CR=1 FL=1
MVVVVLIDNPNAKGLGVAKGAIIDPINIEIWEDFFDHRQSEEEHRFP